MDINVGYELETPSVFIPWNISRNEFRSAFNKDGLREVNQDNFGLECVSLGGLSHSLGIRFDGRPEVGLWYLQLSGNGAPYPAGSFQLFQKHLEMTFGTPTKVVPGEEGFPSYFWTFDRCVVSHEVRERFGPAETVRIERTDR